MTVSMFDAYLERAIANRMIRIIDNSQSTIYAQATVEGRRKLWNSWHMTISEVTTRMLQRINRFKGKSVITWNGMPMDRQTLVSQFVRMFGRRITT